MTGWRRIYPLPGINTEAKTMPILKAYIVPHPPLLVPEIGQGAEREISKTVEAYESIAKEIAELTPDTIVFITPHSASYHDYIHISPGLIAEGDFSAFGARDLFFGIMYEKRLINDITAFCEERGIRAGNANGKADESLDHGTLVPLYYIHKYFQDFRCVRISVSGLPFNEHYKLGAVVTEALENFYRNTVVIASGDLSHRLRNSPYGYSEEGEKFDAKTCEIIKSGNLKEFMNFNEDNLKDAAECGLRAFIIMTGMLDNIKYETELLSYEGPFGVGYAVAGIQVLYA
jgi:aromatic ring-opening dioxygenase LigB subunit